MAKVLITGATGFIGNHVTRLCLEQGDAVRVMVMPGEDRSPLHGMDVEFVEGQLQDPDSLVRAVQGVEQLYHLAALFKIWTRDPNLHYKINVDGARAMMNAAKAAGVEKIVVPAIARWNACECRFGMPATTGPPSRSAGVCGLPPVPDRAASVTPLLDGEPLAPAPDRTATMRPSSPTLICTSRAHPSGSSAAGA